MNTTTTGRRREEEEEEREREKRVVKKEEKKMLLLARLFDVDALLYSISNLIYFEEYIDGYQYIIPWPTRKYFSKTISAQ